MLFPEGTTTNGLRVLRFHSRLFRPAELTGTTVQPIALRYWGEAAERVPFVGNDAFLPHLLELLKASRIDLHLHYCDSVPAGQDRSTAASLSRRAILGAISLPDRPMRRSAGLELSSKRNQAIT
jgi:1-acyl-sn-glycerol-3-phosphate acyltransferase